MITTLDFILIIMLFIFLNRNIEYKRRSKVWYSNFINALKVIEEFDPLLKEKIRKEGYPKYYGKKHKDKK